MKVVLGLVVTALVIGAILFFVSRNNTINDSVSEGEAIVLTVASPEEITPAMLEDFLSEYPNVTVRYEYNPPGYIYRSAAGDIQAHLDAAGYYISAVDVAMVNTASFSAEGTKAGYFLNLQPLIDADAEINPEDYDAAQWQSFQWEGGQWAVPLNAHYFGLFYDRTAFDQAGLAYPKASWTFEQLASAASSLAEPDVYSGLLLYFSGRELLLKSLLSTEIYMVDASGERPNIYNAEVLALLEQWQSLPDGIIGDLLTEGADPFAVPMQVTSVNFFDFLSEMPDRDWQLGPLPNGYIGLTANGFAVNQATQHPELAYALAKYLSTQPELLVISQGDAIAHQLSAETVQSPWVISDALRQTIADYTMLPASELRYMAYVNVALERMLTQGVAPDVVLRDAQASAEAAVAAAEQRRGTIQAPEVLPTIAPGKIMLTFGGIESLIDPNSAEVQNVVTSFTEQDAEVGQIEFTLMEDLSAQDLARHDCFYMPLNILYERPVEWFIQLDPLIQADTTSNLGTIPVSVVNSISVDGSLYGFPIDIRPHIIRYDTSEWLAANTELPSENWTFADFYAQTQQVDGTLAFASEPFDTTSLIALMSGAGAVIYDYRTDPPTVDLTNPAYLPAIQQVLDLAKQGLIAYPESGTLAMADGQSIALFHAESWNEFSSKLSMQSFYGTELIPEDYGLLGYPSGSQGRPLIYEVGAGYINASTPYPDACYRWISYLARQSHLISGIPAQVNLLEEASPLLSQGDAILNYARTVVDLLNSPQLLPFLPGFQRFNNRIDLRAEYLWIGQAFDAYVLENASLEEALSTAQEKIETLRTCRNNISDAPASNRLNAEIACVREADPSMVDLFTAIEP